MQRYIKDLAHWILRYKLVGQGIRKEPVSSLYKNRILLHYNAK